MDMECEIVENFGSILLMEWIEKANSLIPNGGVNKYVDPYLENGIRKSLALLHATFKTILSVIPEREHKEFIVWCADKTQVKIKGEILNLRALGFFDDFMHEGVGEQRGKRK